ncbi:MAG: DUF433 domain-containing protein [Deltaproteobacteria bacterium]|nr:DUF433 domain-containing protein [Deltaproteobacteria bacterium]
MPTTHLQQGFNVNEVAALLGLEVRRVRKEVEHGLFGSSSPPRFTFADLVYFAILARADSGTLSLSTRKKLHALVVVEARRKRAWHSVEIAPLVEVRVDRAAKEAAELVREFNLWRKKLVTKDTILGGEPVFPRSRLAVRHVGGMLLKGLRREEIREDYPYLTDEDLRFALIFTRAYPAMGRPPEHQAAAR